MLLPPGEVSWGVWMAAVHGVVLSGGSDVQPRWYGGEATEHVQPGDEERDESELAVTSALLDRDVPTLFVCRGMQVLNVALGGTLHPHIPDLGIGDIHRDGEGMWTLHDVTASPGSRIADAMGTGTASPVSGHHQAADRIGTGLAITATAPDGVVEAVEVADATWAVGVQWHPEVTAAEDATQQGIFDALVSVAADRR